MSVEVNMEMFEGIVVPAVCRAVRHGNYMQD